MIGPFHCSVFQWWLQFMEKSHYYSIELITSNNLDAKELDYVSI